MVRHGISDTNIKKILGGNFLRVFNKVTLKKEKKSSAEADEEENMVRQSPYEKGE
jgi:hypothetical protein